MARKKVTGSRPLMLWGIIAIIVVLVVVVIAGLLVIYPDYRARQDAAQATVQAQAQVEQHYQAGIAFQNVEDWDKALAEFEQVIRIDASYRDVQAQLANVKARQREATAIAQVQAPATATVQAQATISAQAAAATTTVEAMEAHYEKGVAYMNLSRWEEAKAELQQVFEGDPNYKEVQAKLTEVEVEIAKLTPTVTPSPLVTNTPTSPAATATPRPEERHPGEVNLLESNQPLPAGWFTNGEFTYWEGFLHVQDEPFIDVIIQDCGDDEGNGRLDIVQIFDPENELVVNERNLNGDPKFRIHTYQKQGYYRIFLQDNDTGSHNGNGGTLIVEMLKDQMIYLNP